MMRLQCHTGRECVLVGLTMQSVDNRILRAAHNGALTNTPCLFLMRSNSCVLRAFSLLVADM